MEEGFRREVLGWKLYSLPRSDRVRTGRQPAILRGKKHSIERDKQAVGYAYDTSNEFYSLFLDKELLYTCAYFKTPDDSLEDAQLQKMDLVCRKLRLKPGDRFLDIGCGWGGLIIHAAKRYGVQAVGATLSRNQAEAATERIRQAGLSDRCRVEYQDYREIKDPVGFDKIASIGMQEHVGDEMLFTYFKCAFNLLKPGGVFLNHAINRLANKPPQPARFFSQKFVFPDGELRPVNVVLREAENAGFEVRDVESLREHYAMTLAHWRERLEKARAEAIAVADESTYRIFRLYLAGARNGFRTGLFNLHQSLLCKPDNGQTRLPLTRAEWYS